MTTQILETTINNSFEQKTITVILDVEKDGYCRVIASCKYKGNDKEFTKTNKTLIGINEKDTVREGVKLFNRTVNKYVKELTNKLN